MALARASSENRRKTVARFTVPIVFAALCIFALILGLLHWSASEVDRIADDRDRAIVRLVLAQSIERVAHIQESATVWDEAVRQVGKPVLDPVWLDLNLGGWFERYAGIDEIYILDPRDRPIYAMRQGQRVAPESYEALEGVAGPLARLLRTTRTVEAWRRLLADRARPASRRTLHASAGHAGEAIRPGRSAAPVRDGS